MNFRRIAHDLQVSCIGRVNRVKSQPNQVLVFNDQPINERGAHDELLALGGFYHQLYMSQYHRLAELEAV